MLDANELKTIVEQGSETDIPHIQKRMSETVNLARIVVRENPSAAPLLGTIEEMAQCIVGSETNVRDLSRAVIVAGNLNTSLKEEVARLTEMLPKNCGTCQSYIERNYPDSICASCGQPTGWGDGCDDWQLKPAKEEGKV
jgi:coenzyme F420-reducing hydrogenase beta subunit